MIDTLLLPDRYEGLEKKVAQNDLPKIIVPVQEGLDKIDELYAEMQSTGRGGFLILKGKSGCGKTTFLKTVFMFRENIEIITISNDMELVKTINKTQKTTQHMRIIIIEGRESIIDSNNNEINSSIHAINQFIRSSRGENTLVVWPCNNQDIIDVLVDTSSVIGGSSLLDLEESYFTFKGPNLNQYTGILKQTIELLNKGKTMLDFGVTDEEAENEIKDEDTIGQYLKRINKIITKNKKYITELKKKEQCKMWIIVLAANEPSKDVEALTKGEFLDVDIQRLLASTNANIVTEIKKYPNQIAILANYLDCKIIYMPIVTTLSVIRSYAENSLKGELKSRGMSNSKDVKVQERLTSTELVRVLKMENKTKGKGGKTGPNSIKAFEKLTDIATSNDRILNKTFGEALLAGGIIDEFNIECDFGKGLTRRTDLVCKKDGEVFRLEFMWRKKTSQAEISNYTLDKLFKYGKALEILE